MIYIYNCYGGTHSSSMAAAVHLGKLTPDRIPTRDDILNIDLYNKLTYADMGRLIYRGTDKEGCKVFTLGRGTSKVLVPCLRNLIMLLNEECGISEKVIFSNMSPTVTLPMTIGGFFSRGLGIDFIGVPLLVFGSKLAYTHVVELVNKTRELARNHKESVLILENKG
jgi:hypothetical protein